MNRLGHRSIAVVALAALGLAACGGGGSDDASSDTEAPPDTEVDETVPDTEPADTEPEETTVDTEATSGGIDQIQPSIIQIEATGTIRDPEVGMNTGAGRGSGFIISDDGLAVTNNHVVTGAATLEVFIGGDSDTSYNATVLGVSECNDLALIDISEDDSLTPLQWYEGEVSPGKEIYVAGFPLGDPEYTLTRGVISKAEADGDTPWSSIDSVYEHDANAQPGNSGGPLVSTDGEVVGVHYASGSQTNTSQFFAIPGDTAQDVVEKLMEGDFESIGVNGQVVLDEEAGVVGVWVAGVAPGSPADDAELLPGDIIQTMNGIPIGTDGTMSAYCDVLRTAGDNPIQIEVLRFDTSEILTGEINGDEPLEQTFSFAEAVEEEVDVEAATEAETYDSYQTIVDDTGTLTVDVPSVWTSIDTAPITLDDGSPLGQITASPDIEAYSTTWDVPGLFYSSVQNADILTALATFAPGDACVDAGQTEYQDAAFLGTYQVWTNCGGTDTLYVVLAAAPLSGSGNVSVLAMQVVTDADLDALDQAFATFNTTG
jgi:serine protease Do